MRGVLGSVRNAQRCPDLRPHDQEPGGFRMSSRVAMAVAVPQNLEAEKSILGAILVDNKALPVAAKTVTSGDFFSTINQKIFRRMIQMTESGNPIDLVTLTEALHTTGELSGPTETAYIASLFDGTPRVSHI